MDRPVKGWKEIPQSQELREFLQGLSQGVCVITRAKNAISNDGIEKIQIEFAEKLNLGGSTGNSAAGLFNVGVEGFTSGAQHCWMTAVATQAKDNWGVEIPDGEASIEIMKEVPDYKGFRFAMQYTEVLESQLNENQKEYPESFLKRAGAEGNYFYHESGERVAALKRIITLTGDQQAVHTRLEGAYLPESTSVSRILGGNQAAISSEVAQAGG